MKTGVSKGQGVYKERELLDQLLSVKIEVGIACWVFVTDHRLKKNKKKNPRKPNCPACTK